MKNRTQLSLHLGAWLILCALGAYIIWAKYGINRDFTQNIVETTLLASSGQLRTTHKTAIHEMEDYIIIAGGDTKDLDSLFALMQICRAVDTLMEGIDDLAEDFQEDKAKLVSKNLWNLKMKAMATLSRKPQQFPLNDYLQAPAFSLLDSNENWLRHAKKTCSPNAFKLQLAQAKALTTIYENALADYYLRVSNPNYCGLITSGIDMCLTCLNPTVGDTVRAAFVIASHQNRGAYNTSFELNGMHLNYESGVAPFKLPLTTPGLFPLQLRVRAQNALTDSIQVFEKTYFVHVK